MAELVVGLPCGHTDPPGCDGIHAGGLLNLLPGVTERDLADARREVLRDLPRIYGDDQEVLF